VPVQIFFVLMKMEKEMINLKKKRERKEEKKQK